MMALSSKTRIVDPLKERIYKSPLFAGLLHLLAKDLRSGVVVSYLEDVATGNWGFMTSEGLCWYHKNSIVGHWCPNLWYTPEDEEAAGLFGMTAEEASRMLGSAETRRLLISEVPLA